MNYTVHKTVFQSHSSSSFTTIFLPILAIFLIIVIVIATVVYFYRRRKKKQSEARPLLIQHPTEAPPHLQSHRVFCSDTPRSAFKNVSPKLNQESIDKNELNMQHGGSNLKVPSPRYISGYSPKHRLSPSVPSLATTRCHSSPHLPSIVSTIHKKYSDCSTAELTRKAQKLTRTLSGHLQPDTSHMPSIHDISRAVLQQPALEDTKMENFAMNDDTCSSVVFGQGKLCFSLSYIEKIGILQVTIKRAIHLPLHSNRRSVNAYVKLRLTREGSAKYQTDVQKLSSNPYFNKSFVFAIQASELGDKILRLSVHDHCRVTHDVLIGYVEVSLREVSRSAENHSRETIWRELKTEEECHHHRGEIKLTIKYERSNQTFTMNIVEARNIKLQDQVTPLAGVYIRVSMLIAEEVLMSKRTHTDHCDNGCPLFNEKVSLSITYDELTRLNAVVAVYGKRSFSHCELVGRTTVGSYTYTTGQGLDHWNSMVASSQHTAAMWHILT